MRGRTFKTRGCFGPSIDALEPSALDNRSRPGTTRKMYAPGFGPRMGSSSRSRPTVPLSLDMLRSQPSRLCRAQTTGALRPCMVSRQEIDCKYIDQGFVRASSDGRQTSIADVDRSDMPGADALTSKVRQKGLGRGGSVIARPCTAIESRFGISSNARRRSQSDRVSQKRLAFRPCCRLRPLGEGTNRDSQNAGAW